MRAPLTILATFTSLAPLAACGDELLEGKDNLAPTAIAGDDRAGAVGVALAFDGSSSHDDDGTLAKVAWDFGDGANAGRVRATHAFASAGTYTVTLTVTDDHGATASDTLVVTITDASDDGLNAPPVAMIASALAAATDVEIAFDGAGSFDPDGTLASFAWDFGDGSVSDESTVAHAFASPGDYTVTLTVTDDEGAVDDASLTVSITHEEPPPPPPDLSGSWTWTLVDESQRDLGFACGSFEDSQLTIAASEPSITITEHAGGFSVPYDGTLTGAHFDVTHSGFGMVQRIAGTFDSATSFTGVYGVDPGTDCPDRAVVGHKL